MKPTTQSLAHYWFRLTLNILSYNKHYCIFLVKSLHIKYIKEGLEIVTFHEPLGI